MATEASHPPVLILGCGRSGTSIFGELFQGLASYRYSSEPDFADLMQTFAHNHAAKVPVESPSFPADTGLSFPLGVLLTRFPHTRIYWIVRHPFDAVSSLRVGISKGWSHHPRPPDWHTWLDQPLVSQCAHHWAYINGAGFRLVKDVASVVRFEDLISSPLGFAQKICAELGMAPDTHSDALATWAKRVQNTNNQKKFVKAATSRAHSRPDHHVRVGRWRENLSMEETQLITRIVATANEAIGYGLTDDRVQAG